MDANERRKKIIDILIRELNPMSATALAAFFKVSRQIIVGDIALLRATGTDILATPRGYILQDNLSGSSSDYIGTIACKHDDYQMSDELLTIVDLGGTVVDVTVEHAIYGQLIGALNVSCRNDVIEFIDKINRGAYKPLSALTDGIHLHKIRCKDLATFEKIVLALKHKKYYLGE